MFGETGSARVRGGFRLTTLRGGDAPSLLAADMTRFEPCCLELGWADFHVSPLRVK